MGVDEAARPDSMLQEIADRRCDFTSMRFKREVTGIEEANDRARDVALERLGSRRQKKRIIFAPRRQERRLVRAKICLERGIESNIALKIAHQVELDLVGAR